MTYDTKETFEKSRIFFLVLISEVLIQAVPVFFAASPTNYKS